MKTNERELGLVYTTTCAVSVVCLIALFISFLLSYRILYRATRKHTNVSNILNPQVVCLNICFSLTFLAANSLFYTGLELQLSEGMLLTEVVSQMCGFLSELTLLLLARKFGTQI